MKNAPTTEQIKTRQEKALIKFLSAKKAAKAAWDAYKSSPGIDSIEGQELFLAAKAADKAANYAGGVLSRINDLFYS